MNAPILLRGTIFPVNQQPFPDVDRHQQLLELIHTHLDELDALLVAVDGVWVGEDFLYRFWHHSMKVYFLQEHTEAIIAALAKLVPAGRSLHPWFLQIVDEGTGKKFVREHNENWLVHTRPIVEAFFHARSMLAMAVKYGRDLDSAPQMLPSGWAMLLELYQIR